MDFFTKRENYFILEEVSIFGNFNLFNVDKFYHAKKKWMPCYVYALEESIVFKVNYAKAENYIKKLIQ